jgi:hypothetical protein
MERKEMIEGERKRERKITENGVRKSQGRRIRE